MAPVRTVGVIGAGSFGTSLAALLADKGLAVTLWSHGEDSARAIREEHENKSICRESGCPRHSR